MHTLPILAEYLMSWSCSLWRFKFTISWTGRLTVCPMAGRFKVRKYRRPHLTWPPPPHQNKAQWKVKGTLAVVTILVSGHIDNLIISQSFTTNPGAVVQSEIIVNFSIFWVWGCFIWQDQTSIYIQLLIDKSIYQNTNINIFWKGQSYSNHIASGQGSKNRIDKNIVGISSV